MKRFGRILFGQFVSRIGSITSAFALGVWVYQKTGSVTHLALLEALAVLPFIVAAPIGGTLADRVDRRRILILCDTGAAISTLSLLVALSSDSLALPMAYAATAIGSTCTALQLPALQASVTMLVPAAQLGRAAALIGVTQALASISAPPLATLMLAGVGLEWVLIADLVSFAIAIVTLIGLRIPMPDASGPRASFFEDLLAGWQFVARRSGLLALVGFQAAGNFAMASVQVLMTPFVLSFASMVALGGIAGFLEAGAMAGAVVLAIAGTPRRAMPAVFAGAAAFIVCMAVVAVDSRFVTMSIAAAVVGIQASVAGTCVQTLLQRKIDPAIQGRVFAIGGAATQLGQPVAFLLAGPLADALFEPALAPGGALAGSVGTWLGVGEGRGIALMFLSIAALYTLVLGWAVLFRPLRELDDWPDAPAETAGAARDTDRP